MDDGRLTDGQGRTVDFKNSIIIMTSNLGSQTIQETQGAQRNEMVMEILRQSFKPEFLNRIDDIITFNNLNQDHLKQIVNIQLALLRKRLEDRKLFIKLTDSALVFIVDHGYDPVYGARPLKRAIQRHIQDPLALNILEGKFMEGDEINIDVNPSVDSLVFN